MNDIKKLSELFKNKYGFSPEQVTRMPGAGSGRRYYRLSGRGEKCVGVGGENLRDCRSFLNLNKVFLDAGVYLPEVYAFMEDGLYYIQEDLGDESLFSYIRKGSPTVEEYVKKSLSQLLRLQTIPYIEWENLVEYRPFSLQQIMWDLNYFKYEYLKPSGVDFDEERLEDDFDFLANRLLRSAEKASGFMYRDFQSRNIIIKDAECYFIDYQGGRYGPMIYDVISLLYQAKAGFSGEFREEMINFYANEYASLTGKPAEDVLCGVKEFRLFRLLQVLGAYGLRGLVEKKAHFLESIPPALANLSDMLKGGDLDAYPELKRVGEVLVCDSRFSKEKENGPLVVEVVSFSYKKGYPENYTGNGGGFMFDCRGMHNPGRYAEYKNLTGMDKPVIDFLREKGETDKFSVMALDLVSPTVDRYIKRGFTHLQIGFGCTGGQHRSVYCAEKTSRLLADRFPEAVIKLRHREQGVDRIYINGKEIE